MVRTIRSLDRPDPGLERVAKANGFSLHAGVSCEEHQRDKRERLFRYHASPAVAVPRLSLSPTGKVLYTLETPYRDGTTQVAFEPVTWAQRPTRVFKIDIEVCGRCGGSARFIADASDRCIEQQDIIDEILAHLRDRQHTSPALPLLVPPSRAPPETFPLFAGSESTTTTPNQHGSH
jgi:putative transposase